MSAGLSLRSMRWRCHCRVGILFEATEMGVEGEDSEVNREERKRGEISDFIVVVVSAEDILCVGVCFFAQILQADIGSYMISCPKDQIEKLKRCESSSRCWQLK